MKKKNDLTVIHLDRPRFLRYGHKSLKQLAALGVMDVANEKMNMSDFSLEDLEKIIYCGLLSDARDNDEKLTLDDMEDLLDHAESFQDIMNSLTEAFEKAFGTGSKGEEKN
jgi:hypothetical protein